MSILLRVMNNRWGHESGMKTAVWRFIRSRVRVLMFAERQLGYMKRTSIAVALVMS